MGTFTPLEERLTNIKESLDRAMPDIIAQAIMIEVMAMHKERIFDKGQRTDGTPIGEYSTDASYFAKDKFIRQGAFKPKGKPNKDGKHRTTKTMYISTGYSGFRDIQGRKTDRINLKYSGSLENNIQVVANGNETLYGTTDTEESIKFNALEDKFEAFGLSQNEIDYLKEEIAIHATEITTK